MFLVISCDQIFPVEMSRISIGKIIDVSIIQAEWNSDYKTQIKTEKMLVVVESLVSIDLGKEAFKSIYSDQSVWFSWEGHNKLYRMWQ